MHCILRSFCRTQVIDAFKTFEKLERYGVEISHEFRLQMKENDVLTNSAAMKEGIDIIYSTEDEVVDNDDILKLSEVVKCSLYPLEGAGHADNDPGTVKRIIKIALKVFDDRIS